MNHVALCFTDITGAYYKHALVTALSILDNTKKPLCLHLIHDDTLSGDATARFTDVCGNTDKKFVFTALKISLTLQWTMSFPSSVKTLCIEQCFPSFLMWIGFFICNCSQGLEKI